MASKYKAPAFKADGAKNGERELPDVLFDGTVHEAAMWQVVKAYLANQRQATASVKTRSEVSGGNRKPWRQKGTGRARQGSIRAPQWIGGGVVFGPHPRKYTKAMPRQMRRLAIRSALSAKMADDRVTVVRGLAEVEGRTKAMKAVIEALPESRSVLIVMPETVESIVRGAGNLPDTKTIIAPMLNVRDVLKYDRLIVTEEAIEVIEGLWALPEEKRQPSQWKLQRQAEASDVAEEVA